MTSYDVLVYGSWTRDHFSYQGKVIQDYGGMANVIRNLRPGLKLKYIETELNYVNIDMEKKQSQVVSTIHYKNGLSKKQRYNWIHLAYLDWLKPSLDVMEFMRDVGTYITADVAGFGKSLDGLEKYIPYIDVMFCSDQQVGRLMTFQRFMHGDFEWSFAGDRYKFTKPDITFDVGAGDTLVAAVLNTCRSPMEITHKFSQINKSLNVRLKERDKWWRKRIS